MNGCFRLDIAALPDPKLPIARRVRHLREPALCLYHGCGHRSDYQIRDGEWEWRRPTRALQEDKAALATKAHEERIEEVLEQAFEAGIACALRRDELGEAQTERDRSDRRGRRVATPAPGAPHRPMRAQAFHEE